MYYLKIETKTEVQVIALEDNFMVTCKTKENKDYFLSLLKQRDIPKTNENGLEYKYLFTSNFPISSKSEGIVIFLTRKGEDESRWIIEPDGSQCPLDSFFRC